MSDLMDKVVSNFDTIEAKGEYILVRTLPVQEKTNGGIIIPDSVQTMVLAGASIVEVMSIGERSFVNALGESVYKEPIKTGDWILVSKYSGQSVKKDLRDYRFIMYSSVMGKITEEDLLINLNNKQKEV